MAKHLRTITEGKLEGVKKSTTVPGSTGSIPGVDYDPKAPDDQEFVKLHSTEKHADRVGNGPDVYAGSKQKPSLETPAAKNMGRKNIKDSMKVNEGATCNESPAGTKCPVHDLDDCSGKTGKSKYLLLDKNKMNEESVEEGIRPMTRKYSSSKDDPKKYSNEYPKPFRQPGTPSKSDLRSIISSASKGKTITKLPAGKAKGIKEEEQIDEVLTKKTPVSSVIHDFVHSDNPKFAGKSKKERQKMALGAYYGMHPEKSKKVHEDAAEPMLEGGKKKKTQKEDGQIMPAKTDSGAADDAARLV